MVPSNHNDAGTDGPPSVEDLYLQEPGSWSMLQLKQGERNNTSYPSIGSSSSNSNKTAISDNKGEPAASHPAQAHITKGLTDDGNGKYPSSSEVIEGCFWKQILSNYLCTILVVAICGGGVLFLIKSFCCGNGRSWNPTSTIKASTASPFHAIGDLGDTVGSGSPSYSGDPDYYTSNKNFPFDMSTITTTTKVPQVSAAKGSMGNTIQPMLTDLIANHHRQPKHANKPPITNAAERSDPFSQTVRHRNLDDESLLPGSYAATLIVKWQLALDMSACAGEFTPKKVSCQNGNLTLVEVLNPNVECTSVDSSTMECTDTTADFFVNDFSGAVFNCTSDNALPQLEATYLSGPAYCEEEDSVSHIIQMGTYCSVESGGPVAPIFFDYLFECGSNSELNKPVGDDYSCVVTETFGANELGFDNLKKLAQATVRTGSRWTSGALDTCYSFVAEVVATPLPTPVVTTLSPTLFPTTQSTTPRPTLVSVNLPVPAPTQATPSPTLPVNPDAIYFVDYQARFKRVLDDGCVGPSQDTVTVICENGQLSLTGTSDPSITCFPPEDYRDSGQQAECWTACNGAECDAIYVDRESQIVFGVWVLNEELYAEINFRCHSFGDVNGVDALFYVDGSEYSGVTGFCSGEGNGSGQNLLLAELNPLCGADYVNDDAYAECSENANNLNGRYTCLTGDFCSDAPCSVTYLTNAVLADHHQFQECIQSDDGSGIPEPDEPVGDDEPLEGQYTARFKVGSGFYYDDDACEGSKTGLRVECLGGDITMISSDPDKSCEVTGSSTIECQELTTSVVNEHVDVVEYECISFDQLPHTRAEYYATAVSCESRRVEKATRWVNMAVLCRFPGDISYVSEDWVFECAKDNKYDRTTDDVRASCGSEVTVPEDSTGEFHEIGPAIIFTDNRWQYDTVEWCHSFIASAARSPQGNPDGPGV